METSELILLDGAMGTMLQSAGLPAGLPPEVWNITEPDKVTAVHKQYIAAGSRVIYTNTFGVNRFKTERCGYSVKELVTAAIACAVKAAEGSGVKIALDIGPLGKLLEPLGTLKIEEAAEAFREIVTAGKEAGADLVIIETMSDLAEAKAALLAVKECSNLPVWITMTFESNGRTFLGTTIPSMALTLEGLGADAIGFNCSLGPEELLPMIDELREWTSLPLILKPNAGLPDPATGTYPLNAETFARLTAEAPKHGIQMLGGCCGTSPAFIQEIKKSFTDTANTLPIKKRFGVCSANSFVEMHGVHVIGERINPTGKKSFQQALREGDMDYIVSQALQQQAAGAEILDINVGIPGIDEATMMEKVVKAVQAATDLPLQLDSSDPAAIEAGLRVYNGKAVVNSVNGKEEVLDAVLPLCKKYGAAAIGLCLDENGLPQTREERIAIAERILEAALNAGLAREDVFIDCLTLTVSAQQNQAAETLKAVRYVHDVLGLHTVLGVSNISFGLPKREQITAAFLLQAMEEGLDLPILNPCQDAVMNAVYAYRVLSGQDRGSTAYIAHFSEADEKGKAAPVHHTLEELSVKEAILRGLKSETRAITQNALASMDELEVVNALLIPALDAVGSAYEAHEIFLPQLINAANAANEGFEAVRSSYAKKGKPTATRGRILMATVQGDIHDIGKNIVRVVLENYGYSVLDLGRDVPAREIVDAAIQENITLVGLSALMTTTVKSMAEAISALKASGHACKIMVGGAVLTPEYAAEIGADYYAKDAKHAADIAKEVLG